MKFPPVMICIQPPRDIRVSNLHIPLMILQQTPLAILLAAKLLPPPVRRTVDVAPRPWPHSRRRYEENATTTAQEGREEQTGHVDMDQNHWKGIYGDAITQRKDNGKIRILLQNPGGIGFVTGQRNRESFKIDKLKKIVNEKQIDIVSLTKVNKDWRCVPTENTVWAATSTWRERRKIQVSHNTTGPQVREHQIGGTISMAFDSVSFRISDREQDSRGLGRWSWMDLNGVGGLKTTIITAYCPANSSGLGGCYTQHLTYMRMHCKELESSCHFIPETINCPRQLFGNDLRKFVEERIKQGNQIILMGDFNSEYAVLRDWMLNLDCLISLEKSMGTNLHLGRTLDQKNHLLITSLRLHRLVVHSEASFHLANWMATIEAFG